MELIDYLRLVRRRVLWVLVPTLVGLVLAVVYAQTRTKTYEATAELFVGTTRAADTTPAEAQSASRFTLDRMSSYALLVDSPSTLQAAHDQLGLTASASSLAGHLAASAVNGTVLLRVTATEDSGREAARLADAAAAALGTTIEQVEQPTGGASPLSTTVTRPASVPGSPSSPDRTLLLALGLVAGLGVGLVAAAVREQAVRSRPEPVADPVTPSRPVAAGATGSAGSVADEPSRASAGLAG